jgi:hypothetical protein
MTQTFIKKSVMGTTIVVAAIALILFGLGRVSWALGLLAATAWSMANFLMTLYLIDVAILKKDKKRLSLVLGIKFPVLYLVGFWLLVSRFFPISSLLVGMCSLFVVMGALRLCPKPA